VGALAQFAEQPRVLHGNHRLRGEVLQERNLLLGERLNLRAEDQKHPHERGVFAQRDGGTGARAAELDQSATMRIARES